jgi:ketosteroid isomerase-like protein
VLRIHALPLALLATACAATPPPASSEALRASLTQAELDFAAATAARGVDGWVNAFAPDGMSLDAKGTVVRGHAAIREAMTPVLAKVKIVWKPTVVDVAPSGEMGFTYGLYQVLAPDAAGKPSVASHGAYMTVWRRQADGSWKVVADMGSKDTSAQ